LQYHQQEISSMAPKLFLRSVLFGALVLAAAFSASARASEEVNLYSYRQPALMQPLLEASPKIRG
jgi:hypothetical protein